MILQEYFLSTNQLTISILYKIVMTYSFELLMTIILLKLYIACVTIL